MTNYPLDGLMDSTSLVDFSGAFPTINAGDNTTFDVSAGELKFVDNTTNPGFPIVKTIKVPALTGVTPLGTVGATFLYYDDTGTLIHSNLLQSGAFLRDNVGIGILTHEAPGTPITGITGFTPVAPQSPGSSFSDLSFSLGAINNFGDQGNITTPDGSNMSLNKSDGSWFYSSINVRTSTKSPNITDSPSFGVQDFLEAWHTTDAPFLDTTFRDTIRTGIYDDGTATQADNAPVGVLQANEWANHRIFHITDFNIYGVQYGETVYGNPVAAILGIKSEEFTTTTVLRGTTPKCTLTTRGGATRLDLDTNAIFRQASETGEFI
jgi:hypothetical protein